MRRATRFTLALVLGLGLVTWAASIVVQQTTHAWFEKDLNLRAQLVVNGARQALIAHWQKDQPSDLQALLVEITRDERILAAAACDANLTPLTQTLDLPDSVDCSGLGPHVRRRADSPAATWKSWSTVEPLPRGQIHISAIPIPDGERALGFVVLVHDLSF